jgi:membrane-associated phospholipid phosphatase
MPKKKRRRTPETRSFSQLWKRSRFFLIGYVLFLLFGLFFFVNFPKGEVELNVNALHGEDSDFVFRYLTHLGDGYMAIALALFLFLFWRMRGGVAVLASYILSGIPVVLFKRFLMPDSPRPRKFFAELGVDFHTIENVVLHGSRSFPSGHTATAFALFVVLTLLFPGRWRSLVFLAFALLAGFSRVYLMQHFVGDVLAGSFFGVVFGLWAWWLCQHPSPVAKWRKPLLFQLLPKK